MVINYGSFGTNLFFDVVVFFFNGLFQLFGVYINWFLFSSFRGLLPWISRTPTPYNFEPFGSTAFVAAAAVVMDESMVSMCCWHFFVFDLAGHVPYARSVADSRNCVSVSNNNYICFGCLRNGIE